MILPEFLYPHRLVDRHFAGGNSAFGERRLWRHLPRCQPCRERYRSHSLLESLDGEAAGATRARDRMGRSLFAESRRPRWLLSGGVAVVLAGATALLLVRRPVLQDDGNFVARGGRMGPASAASVSLSIFRLPSGGGKPQPAGGSIGADDGLVFAYSNPTSRGRRYLMVLATAATGQVFWYWPAWTDPAAAPAAVPIQAGDAPVELTESVRHQLSPGTLQVVGLFCDQPLTVKDVEAALSGGDSRAPALDDLGCDLWRQPLEVTGR